MSKIRVKNFGPIKEGYLENDGWIDIEKVTVFIGNQGSGKSTIAKLISTFSWIEKALVRGDYDKKTFERKNKLKNQFLNYHRLENYFKINGVDHTIIEYKGDAYNIAYQNGFLLIEKNEMSEYALPQIMYVPAERNFISYVKTPNELKLSSPSLKEFLTEFNNAKDEIKGLLKLPINNVDLEYDKLNDALNIRGEGYKVRLTEASSGFQSFVPLYLVSNYLALAIKSKSEDFNATMTNDEVLRFKKGIENIVTNENLTEEQKRIAISVLSSKFNKSSFINIVEEPEQNLFPLSQQKMLYCLLNFNNMNKGNKLILTTHSPYLINYLTLTVKAKYIKDLLAKSKMEEGDTLRQKLENIVPNESMVDSSEYAIYQLNELNGSISKLDTYNGVPSDLNHLNLKLDETNDLFAYLLEIQQSIE